MGVTMRMINYAKEWSFLEKISIGKDINVDLIDEKFNWGELMEQAVRHKLLPILASKLLDEENFGKIPPFINHHLASVLKMNRHKTNILINEAKRINEKFKKREIKFAFTKGILLESLLYEEQGYRFLSDIDMMVVNEDKNKIMESFKELGYKVGHFDWRTNQFREMSRNEYLLSLTAKDHIPEHLYYTGDPLIPYVAAGCTMSFTWSGSGYEDPKAEAFSQLEQYTVYGEQLQGMNHTYHFIYIALHLLKHAWLPSLLKWNNDVNIIKFADVARYWMKYNQILKKDLVIVTNQFHLYKPLVWVFAHTDRLFNIDIVSQLGFDHHIDETFLHSGGDFKGNPRFWKGDMRERLNMKDRRSIFGDVKDREGSTWN